MVVIKPSSTASLGSQDLNLGHVAYQTTALTGLSYTPMEIRAGIELACPALQAGAFTTLATGSR